MMDGYRIVAVTASGVLPWVYTVGLGDAARPGSVDYLVVGLDPSTATPLLQGLASHWLAGGEQATRVCPTAAPDGSFLTFVRVRPHDHPQLQAARDHYGERFARTNWVQVIHHAPHWGKSPAWREAAALLPSPGLH